MQANWGKGGLERLLIELPAWNPRSEYAGVGDTSAPAKPARQPTPIDVSPPSDAAESPRWLPRAVWAFVALGVFLRLVRYLLDFPLWCDEAYVAANFLDRGYAGLLAPLEYGQVCPPLFLWIELASVRLLGFSEWSLRLFPVLCGVAAVLLFRHVAGRLLSGVALVAAVGIFAVSYPPVRHAVEVKPYASDLLVSLVLLALALAWRADPRQTRFLWLLAAAAPLAVWLSYPAVFVAGGVSLALLVDVRTCGEKRSWLAFAAYNATLLLSFAALYAAVGRAQFNNSVAQAATTDFWANRFPPLAHPLQLVVWTLEQHTGRMLGYPIGGDHGGSTLVFVCCVVAVIVLWKQRQWAPVAILLVPFALNLVAAAMHRYPYGGSARVTQHLAPMICLLAGLGAAVLLARLHRAARRQLAVRGLLAALALMGCGLLLHAILRPYKQPYDRQMRDFARYLWREKADDAVLVCTARDLHLDFAAQALAESGAAQAQYRCNQAIFAPHGDDEPAAASLDRISAQRPLRCVMFGRADHEHADAESRWLAEMQERFDWVGYEKHEFRSYYLRREGGKERFELFEFVPKGAAAARGVARRVQFFDSR